MKLSRLTALEFDLAKTLDSGQVFHWLPQGNGFVGMVGASPVYIEQRCEKLSFCGASTKTIRHYFALDHPLAEICRSFPSDKTMNAAAQFCRGLRIIRQPKWECLATFICSSMKQVAHIRQMSLALRLRFGRAGSVCGRAVYCFPSASTLAHTTEKDLRACSLGYRAKNLLLTARSVAGGSADLESWSALTDEALQARLCELPGVGAKVANCVMLFAYERLHAFPVDVWIERVLREQYFRRRKSPTQQKLKEFCADYFGAHGGYAQQYLFHHARKTTPRRRLLSESRRGIVSA